LFIFDPSDVKRRSSVHGTSSSEVAATTLIARPSAGFGLPTFTQKTRWYYQLKKPTKTQLKNPTNTMEKNMKKLKNIFPKEIHNVHVWFALHFIPGYIWLSPRSKRHFKELHLK
jgi:hypothetical protein